MYISNTDHIIKLLLSGEYEYGSDEYGNAVNSIIVEEISDFKKTMYEMSNSNDFTVISALAFILPIIASNEFILDKYSSEIRSSLRRGLEKNYFRANCDFCESILYMEYEGYDYINYIKMINSKNQLEQDSAIRNLLYVDNNVINELNKYSMEYDFSIFNQEKWYKDNSLLKDVLCKSITYKKIAITSIFKQENNKKLISSIFHDNYAELFDYIYIGLPSYQLKV